MSKALKETKVSENKPTYFTISNRMFGARILGPMEEGKALKDFQELKEKDDTLMLYKKTENGAEQVA